MVKKASYSFSLEKLDGDHKSGQYIKAVKRMIRNINLFLIQLSLNCFTETQWLQRHHKMLMAKPTLCPTLPAMFYITFQCTEQSGSRHHTEQLFHMLREPACPRQMWLAFWLYLQVNRMIILLWWCFLNVFIGTFLSSIGNKCESREYRWCKMTF